MDVDDARTQSRRFYRSGRQFRPASAVIQVTLSVATRTPRSGEAKVIRMISAVNLSSPLVTMTRFQVCPASVEWSRTPSFPPTQTSLPKPYAARKNAGWLLMAGYQVLPPSRDLCNTPPLETDHCGDGALGGTDARAPAMLEFAGLGVAVAGVAFDTSGVADEVTAV